MRITTVLFGKRILGLPAIKDINTFATGKPNTPSNLIRMKQMQTVNKMEILSTFFHFLDLPHFQVNTQSVAAYFVDYPNSDSHQLSRRSVELTRRFRLHFNVGRYGRVPSRDTILLWVKNFRTDAMTLKKKPPGDVRSIRTPRNIQAVRQAVQNSPTRSTAKHAIAFQVERNGDVSALDADQHAGNHERYARGLSSGLKKELKAIFNVGNFLSLIQKFIKIFVKIVQTLTSFIPAKTIRESIEHLAFPGANALSVLVEEFLNFINDLATTLSKSDFLTNKPTKENLRMLLSDTVVLLLKKGVLFTAQLKKTAEVAFSETGGAKYDVLDNVEINHPFAKKAFASVHKVIGQITKGINSITSATPREAISNFIKSAPLLHAKELGEIINKILETLYEITTELLNTNFLKEEASVKNINCFVVKSLKSIIIKVLELKQDVLKVILSLVLKMKGQPTEISTDHVKGLEVSEGIAIKLINKFLSFIIKTDPTSALAFMHKSIALSGKVVYEITNDPGVKLVPKMINHIGKEITDLLAKSADFLITHANEAALATTKSRFVNEAPSWENLKDYLLGAIKHLLKVTIEATNNSKTYFDVTFVNKGSVIPDLIKDIIEVLIPAELISGIQKTLISFNRGIIAVTGPLASGALKGFVKQSGLPLADKLAEGLGIAMTSLNELATQLSKSKFFTQEPTGANAALFFVEAINGSISSFLKGQRIKCFPIGSSCRGLDSLQENIISSSKENYKTSTDLTSETNHQNIKKYDWFRKNSNTHKFSTHIGKTKEMAKKNNDLLNRNRSYRLQTEKNVDSMRKPLENMLKRKIANEKMNKYENKGVTNFINSLDDNSSSLDARYRKKRQDSNGENVKLLKENLEVETEIPKEEVQVHKNTKTEIIEELDLAGVPVQSRDFIGDITKGVTDNIFSGIWDSVSRKLGMIAVKAKGTTDFAVEHKVDKREIPVSIKIYR
ncbi:hypothetical protein C0J52_22281 [Blattella germanica]|nr:hypothetical protein C0J52_22281 [Blattella germanica]